MRIVSAVTSKTEMEMSSLEEYIAFISCSEKHLHLATICQMKMLKNVSHSLLYSCTKINPFVSHYLVKIEVVFFTKRSDKRYSF